MAGVLLALGFPLAVSVAAAQQQRVVVDRIDDTVRFAALAQFVTEGPGMDERRSTLQEQLDRYHDTYGIKAGVFYRDGDDIASAPEGWYGPRSEDQEAFQEALTVAQPRPGAGLAVAAGRPARRRLTRRTGRGRRRRRVHRLAHRPAAFTRPEGLAADRGGRVRGDAGRGRRRLPPHRLGPAARTGPGRGHPRHRDGTDEFARRGGGRTPELRRLARSFNEMADNVEEVLEQQRAFVADASHQLRNPLAALLLRIELLALELPEGNEEIASVRTEGKRLAQVLDDLLDLALAEHACADLRLTDIGELAAERVAAWRPLAEEKGVRLTEDRAAVTAWADPVALSSALDAVIDNALKFTPSGEEVTVSVASNGATSTVVITDRGPGLTDEELARIGDRFWRSGRHQNIKGSGLGLSISRALLTAAWRLDRIRAPRALRSASDRDRPAYVSYGLTER